MPIPLFFAKDRDSKRFDEMKGDIRVQHGVLNNGQKRSNSSHAKPFTEAELKAKRDGELYLQMAKQYARNGDRNNAVSCCLEGLSLSFGISRPLAVRDQFDDLLRTIDPTAQIASRIRHCLK